MSPFAYERDMMECYAPNRELLQAKRKRHFWQRHSYNHVKESKKSPVLEKLEEIEPENLKEGIRKSKRREMRIWIVTSIIVAVSLLWMTYKLL
ncbi:MAG: hypothetical protein MK086_02730 [Flavobacteriales bacterium]|nr:hypothetical protein [Flavobacteriales bacterium]